MELHDKYTFATGVSTLTSVASVCAFDMMDRSNRGGELFLAFGIFALVVLGCLLVRILWQILCNKIVKRNFSENIGMAKRLFWSSLYDVIPISVFLCFFFDLTLFCFGYDSVS